MELKSHINEAIFFSVGFGLLLSIIILWGVGVTGVLDAFRNAGWLPILAYVIISILIAIGLTLRWSVVLRAYGVRLPFYTLFIYRLIGFAVSYLTPTAHIGGEPARALLLNKQGIPLKVGFSSAVADRSLEIIFNIIMFFFGSLLILNFIEFPFIARISIFIISLLALLLAIVFIVSVLRRRSLVKPILRFFHFDRRKSWHHVEHWIGEVEILISYFYAKKKRHFRLAAIINFFLWVLMMAEYKLALLILGYHVGFFVAFIFLTGVGVAYSIPIPAALGVLELGQVGAAKILSIPSATAVALAFIIRIRDIIWTIIGIVLMIIFHMNIFNLFERSQKAAQQYNFDKIRLEMWTPGRR